ncbi:(2Fe-2S) ferredoxin domain-containing protein [Bacillus piscicola]|uniref:(2Fe-2S) ferredoxin domain-containing protein n=1 Tax=Bacillus piscicola TaxID=1632684 RepID=UPI001F08ADE6|nr:(2Fe-2S) ferredoxin domain-containing protein [Bacillus piscicola]
MATWNLESTRHHLLICNGGSCMKNGAEALTTAVRTAIKTNHLDDYIHTTRTRCNGRCRDKCVLIAYPEGHWYKNMVPADAPSLIESLKSNTAYLPKLSHSFTGEGFARKDGIESGRDKPAE